jgi:hypothetical protein
MPQHRPAIVGAKVANPVARSPSIDTRYRSPSRSVITTGNVTTRPLRRPTTSSAATRCGQIPAPYATAETRFCIRANQWGRSPW